MNCEKFENLISGYLDGQLSDVEQKQCSEHLSSCSKCAVSLKEYTSFEKILKEAESPLPDEAYWAGFDARLREKIDATAEKAPWWNFFLILKRPPAQWAAAAVTLLIIMVFGMPILREIAFGGRPSNSKMAGSDQNITRKSDESGKTPGTPEMATGATSRMEAAKPQPPGKAEGVSPGEKVDAQADKELESPESPDNFYYAEKKRNPLESTPLAGEKRKNEEAMEKDKMTTSTYAGAPPAAKTEPGGPSATIDSLKGSGTLKKCMPPDDEAPVGESGKAKAGRFDKLYSLKNKVAVEPAAIGNVTQPAPDSENYLASSEVVLLKIVNMSDNPRDLSMLQSNLKSANYVEKLDREKESIRRNPTLTRHNEAMKEITVSLMSIESKGIPGLKHKVLESGILEVTRELKK